MTQGDLFGDPPVSRRLDPSTSKTAERLLNKSGRRRSQKGLILARLEQGPATNVELASLCLKYTGRISDLRHDGYDIRCVRQTEEGVTVYTLEEEA